MKKLGMLASIVSIALIAGCGGGSGSSPSTTISGKVADGYLRDAEVFLDMDNNYRWDAGEPKTTSGAGGAYSMEATAADASKYPVMVRAIAGTTFDEGTNTTVAHGYVMSAPAGAPEFISPMSTLIRENMAANPGMSQIVAMTQLRDQMNLPVGINMMADYVAASQPGSANASQYQTMYETARQMAGVMAGQAAHVMGAGTVDIGRYRGMIDAIIRTMPLIEENALAGQSMDSTFMTSLMSEIQAQLSAMPMGSGFSNYSGMFRNMTSLSSFWSTIGVTKTMVSGGKMM